MSETKETLYGGIQFAMVSGLSAQKSGEGIARLGIYDIKAGQVLSDVEILRSNLGAGLKESSVCADGTFVLVTRQTNFGGPGNPSSVSQVEIPVARIVAEKIVSGVQQSTVQSKSGEAKVVAEKVVVPVQAAVRSTGTLPNV